MDLYAKGQLSYLILSILLERDFYGLDIITEISNRSGGKVNLKKPSVYSNLTRMENQGYVSAYLKNSDLGPNRKYYSITEKGRNFYEELKDYFGRNNIDVFASFSDGQENETSPSVNTAPNNFEEKAETKVEFSESQDEQVAENEDDYFDFSNLDEEKEEVKENVETKNEYFDKFIHNNIQNNVEETVSETKEAEQEEPEKIEETPIQAEQPKEEDVSDYNKKIYDISKDINNYRRKKSFAEDQISINVSSPLSSSNEKTQNNIEELKNSFNETKNQPISQYDFSKQMSRSYNQTMANRYNNTEKPEEEIEEKEPELPDDGKFITGEVHSIERARKIEPPRLKIIESPRDTILPAPKRDTSIDPSHKEILSKLYSKTKDQNSQTNRDDAIYDYSDLKDFYNSQNISFNEYAKSTEKYHHNTNKLYLIISLITFGLMTLASILTYVILAKTNSLMPSFNFLFIIIPALLLIDVGFKYYNFKQYQGWLPAQMLAPWKIWVMTSALLVGTIIFNLIFGLGSSSFDHFSTTLLLPILLILIYIPARYYLKRTIIVKFWR
jgi:PadR family transcriptional regulator PadR